MGNIWKHIDLRKRSASPRPSSLRSSESQISWSSGSDECKLSFEIKADWKPGQTGKTVDRDVSLRDDDMPMPCPEHAVSQSQG